MIGAPAGIEPLHGYTFSGHPIVFAAACATIDLYERAPLFERAARMAPVFGNAIHKLPGERHVIDVRNLGPVGGVDDCAVDCFRGWKKGRRRKAPPFRFDPFTPRGSIRRR